MKTLTIFTHNYRQDLEDLNLPCYVADGLYSTKCSHASLDTDALMCLLERIIILGHPIYGHSPKLADMAIELRHTEIHQTNMLELTRYLKEQDTLHLEGYAAFRMYNYRHKLDMIMYCLIKKLKLADSLLPL